MVKKKVTAAPVAPAQTARKAKVLEVFGAKGGAGKTTLSMQLAGALGRQGYRVLVADLDEQGTASRWAKQALDDQPFPAVITDLSKLEDKAIREIQQHIPDYDFIILDCPPGMKVLAPQVVMSIADLVLVPVSLSPADDWAVQGAKQLVMAHRTVKPTLQAYVVPMMTSKSVISTVVLNDLCKDSDIPVLRMPSDKGKPGPVVSLGNRAVYKECLLVGATVHSMPRAAAARVEVDELAEAVVALFPELAR